MIIRNLFLNVSKIESNKNFYAFLLLRYLEKCIQIYIWFVFKMEYNNYNYYQRNVNNIGFVLKKWNKLFLIKIFHANTRNLLFFNCNSLVFSIKMEHTSFIFISMSIFEYLSKLSTYFWSFRSSNGLIAIVFDLCSNLSNKFSIRNQKKVIKVHFICFIFYHNDEIMHFMYIISLHKNLVAGNAFIRIGF